MIPVKKVRQPKGFKADVDSKGATWMNANPSKSGKELPAYWRTAKNRKYVFILRDGFQMRCGYTAHLIDHGTVDHFYSRENYRKRTYKWSNYRYAASWMNAAKKPDHDGKILDPYEVKSGWFEILLPSMQLQVNKKNVTKTAPHLLSKAEYTVSHLPIRDDERVIRFRADAYKQYKDSPDKPTALLWLKRSVPLIAEAVIEWEKNHPKDPLP